MTWHKKFFTLLLLFFPTQLGLHFWPDWTMVLGRRVDYLSPTLYATDILVCSILASWFVETHALRRLIRHSREGGNLSFIKRWILGSSPRMTCGVMSLLFFVFINIYFSFRWEIAVYAWIKFFEFFLLGLYIVKTKPTFSFIMYHLSFGILFSSLLAIAQFFHQGSIGGILWFLGERTFSVDTPGIARFQSCQLSASSCQLFLRPYATFPHPNVLGGFLAVMLPFLLYEIIRTAKLFKKIFYVLVLCFGLGALFLSFSRSAWIAGAIGLGVSITYQVLRKRQNFLFPIILTTIFLILFFVIGKTFSASDESVVVRQQLNNAAIEQWRKFPIFGVGLGNFLVELPNALPSRQIYFLQPVHNIYLLVLAEAGVVGLGLFLLLIYVAVGRSITYHVSRKGQKDTALSLNTLSLILLLLLGLVDHYPLTLQQGQLLFTLFTALSLVIP